MHKSPFFYITTLIENCRKKYFDRCLKIFAIRQIDQRQSSETVREISASREHCLKKFFK